MSEYRDKKHGRIYRIVPKNEVLKSNPKLTTVDEQIKALSNDNLFWRQQAQHLLVKGGESNIAKLEFVAKSDSVVALHAQHAIAQLGGNVANLALAKVNAGLISASKPTLENAKKWLSDLDKYTPDVQLATLLLACDVERNSELLKILKTEKSKLKHGDRFKKDDLLKRAMELAILSHGTKQDTIPAPKRAPLSKSAIRGEEVYKQTCIACHQPEGGGTPNVFPPLSGSDWLSRHPDHATMVVLKGLTGPITVSGKKFNGVMPAHNNLTNEQVTDVINYVRNAFEVQYGDISKEQVEKIKSLSDCGC